MTLDEILKGLFPSGHDVKTSAAGLITGTGKRKQGGSHRCDRRRERRSTRDGRRAAAGEGSAASGGKGR